MQTIELNRCQIQLIPKPGQVLMYVDLSQVKHCSVTEALNRLEQMGYTPELRYLETGNEVKLYALLLDEQLNSAQPVDDFYRMSERLALFEAFPNDETAIFCPRGLPVQD